MLSFLKKIFGVTPAAKTSAPYKVETPVVDAPKAKKPTVKKATTAKPKKPRTPKA